MNPEDKDTNADKPADHPTDDTPVVQESPADALSRTPDDLADEREATKTEQSDNSNGEEAPKKISKARRLFKKINVYLLLFILVVIVSIIITWVFYLNSQKPEAKYLPKYLQNFWIPKKTFLS